MKKIVFRLLLSYFKFVLQSGIEPRILCWQDKCPNSELHCLEYLYLDTLWLPCLLHESLIAHMKINFPAKVFTDFHLHSFILLSSLPGFISFQTTTRTIYFIIMFSL